MEIRPQPSPASPLLLLARDQEKMQALGEHLASFLEAGDILLLAGELGAGKTTLAQGLARGLGVASAVTSPTFVLLIEHEARQTSLLHLDAYRLEGLSFEEGREAGLEEFFARRDAIRLVEWPSMIEAWTEPFCTPDSTWRISIEHAGAARQLQVLAPSGREVLAAEWSL